MDKVRRWLTEVVEFYRKFGFFGAYRELSRDELVEELLRLELEAGREYDPDTLTSDIQVLRWDDVRVWTEDPFQRITPDLLIYETTLEHWSIMSRGAFEPEQVKERWDGPEGPVWIEFLIHGFPYTLEALHSEYLLDLEIVKEINQLLLHPFYRFEVCEGADEIVSVTVLTPEERVQIERERGLVFHIHDLAHLFEATSLFLLDQPMADGRCFLGTQGDALERPIGRLSLEINDEEITGKYKTEAADYPWSLTYTGKLTEIEEESFSGEVSGTALGVPFQGVWKGTLSDDGRFLYGTWIGRDAKNREFSGTFGTIEEQTFITCEDAYVEALRAWLEEIWVAPNLLAAPLTLINTKTTF